MILNVSYSGYFAETASLNFISYEEVKFIEAEAANRTRDSSDVAAFNSIKTILTIEHNTSLPATSSASRSTTLLTEILEEKK